MDARDFFNRPASCAVRFDATMAALADPNSLVTVPPGIDPTNLFQVAKYLGAIKEGDYARWPDGSFTAIPAQPTPALTSLDPNTAVIGDPDLVLACVGTGFTAECIIYFNNGQENTTYISDTRLETTVKPSLASAAGTVPVKVVNFATNEESASLDFTFTEA